MKFRVPEIVLGALLTVAVFAMGYVAASSVPPPSQQIENTGHEHAADEGAERTAEKQIAYYTKWLAWFTGALVAVSGIQGYFLLRADKTARIAANAADLSARAAIAIELPVIQAEPVGFGTGDEVKDGKFTEHFSLKYFDFTNQGRTKARPIEVKWGWTVGDKLPPVPVYKLDKSFELDAILKPEGKIGLFITTVSMEIAPGDTNRITSRDPNNETELWLYCCFVYEDFMRARHEIGFCWRRHEGFGAGRFVLDATPAYNRKT
jgi:hypothetical protein